MLVWSYLQVYLHSYSSLRDDMRDWESNILRLMDMNPSGARIVLQAFTDAGQREAENLAEEVAVIDGANPAMEVLFGCDVVRYVFTSPALLGCSLQHKATATILSQSSP
jgi:hypothetical protein